MKKSWQILKDLALNTSVAKVKKTGNIPNPQQVQDGISLRYLGIAPNKVNMLFRPIVVLFCPAHFSWSVLSLKHLKK
jgi:hypothetical protein